MKLKVRRKKLKIFVPAHLTEAVNRRLKSEKLEARISIVDRPALTLEYSKPVECTKIGLNKNSYAGVIMTDEELVEGLVSKAKSLLEQLDYLAPMPRAWNGVMVALQEDQLY